MAVSVKIDDTLKDRVRQLAADRRRTPHWIMHEAILQYVAREEARESFLREATASWKDYQSTGRHLTGDEIDTWLDSWGNESGGDAPPCHE